MTRATFLFAAACLCASTTQAQQPPPTSQPGPEHKRLAYFAGNWTSQGEMKQNPFMPAGKFTSTDHNEWFPGGFFLLLHSTAKSPMGTMNGLAIMGYSAEEKTYTYDAFDSMGSHDVSKGTVEGKTWTWMGESKVEGKVIKGRYVMQELSPTSYSFQYDFSTDGSTWTRVMEGKATKVK